MVAGLRRPRSSARDLPAGAGFVARTRSGSGTRPTAVAAADLDAVISGPKATASWHWPGVMTRRAAHRRHAYRTTDESVTMAACGFGYPSAT
jgi:hypothetical protein